MALQLWLPLIDNLNNNGIGNATITTSNTTISTSGKLGKCYTFNGSTAMVDIQYSEFPTILNDDFSICMWIYNSDSGSRSVFFGNYNLTGAFLSIEKTANEKARFWWNASPDIKPSNAIIPVNTWTHLVITRQGNTVKFYVNGALTDTSTTTLNGTVPMIATNFRLGRDGRSDATSFNGKMNDFRLYSHALSPKEIEVISRALTVHHPLSDPGNANLLVNSIPTSTSGWTAGGTHWSRALVDAEGSLNGKAIRATYNGTDGGVRGGVYHSLTAGTSVFAEGDTYTITARLRASVNCEIRFYNNLGATTTTNITTQWATYSISSTVTAPTANGRTYIYMQPDYVTTGAWLECCMLKLEKGSKSTPWIPYPTDAAYTALGFDSTVDYDVSGYNYHGEKLGTLTCDSDSPKYSACTVFDGTSAINCGNSYNVQGAKNMTISLWAYLPDWAISTKQVFISSQQSGGFYIQRGSGTNVSFRCNYYNAEDLSSHTYSTISYDCMLTGWHMLTATYDTSAIRLYIDGVQATSASLSGSYGVYFNPATSVNTYIGAEATGSSYEAPVTSGCKVSDVRIYYTTLTAAQIAELYNTAVSAANNGTLLGYELVES